MAAILIVEDHADTRRSFARLLRTWGHRVTTAETMTSGLESVDAKHFDVILSDIDLPDGTGYHLLAEIRRRNTRAMVVAVTAQSSDDDINAARTAGFDYHLAKPVNLGRLNALLSICR